MGTEDKFQIQNVARSNSQTAQVLNKAMTYETTYCFSEINRSDKKILVRTIV